MKARLGAVLFGFGVLCAVLAAGVAFYVAPAVTKLPPDLPACRGPKDQDCVRPALVEAPDAHFVQVKGDAKPPIALRTGTLRSITEVVPRPDLTASLPDDLRDTAVVWDVYGTVKWAQTDDTIQQSVTEVAIDRVTGAAVSWDKQSLQDAGPTAPSKVAFAGQMYKFPFHTEKRTYDYFDADLRTPLPIEYQATEKVRGLETYRFHQAIGERDLSSPADEVNALLGVFAPKATGGRMTYRNNRTIWVEPVSGSIVKISEQRTQQLVPDDGPPTALVDGTFTFTDDTLRNNVESAGRNRSQLLLISRQGPIGLAVLGALALIGGLLLVGPRRHLPSAPAGGATAGEAAAAAAEEIRLSALSNRTIESDEGQPDRPTRHLSGPAR